MANNIYKTLGANAQTLTILATVCLADPLTQDKAKALLDKALAQRPDYIKAVVKKTELLSEFMFVFMFMFMLVFMGTLLKLLSKATYNASYMLNYGPCTKYN